MTGPTRPRGRPKKENSKVIVAEDTPKKYGRGRPKKGEVRPPKPESLVKAEKKLKRDALDRIPDFETGVPRSQRPDKTPDHKNLRLSDLVGEEPIQTHGRIPIDPEILPEELPGEELHKIQTIAAHDVQIGPGAPPPGKNNPVARALKLITERQLAEVLNELLFADVNELWKIANEAKLGLAGHATGKWSPLQVMVARISCKIMAEGDYKAFDSLMTRLIGKPKQVLNITGPGIGASSRVVIHLPSNGREQKEPA